MRCEIMLKKDIFDKYKHREKQFAIDHNSEYEYYLEYLFINRCDINDKN